jgi:hypothetical protein
MRPEVITMEDYNIVINDNPKKDMKEIILLQQKGDFNFSGASYSLDEENAQAVIETTKEHIVLKQFPSQLSKLILDKHARLVILEINNDLINTMKGNVYIPSLMRKKRIKTGGRTKKEK